MKKQSVICEMKPIRMRDTGDGCAKQMSMEDPDEYESQICMRDTVDGDAGYSRMRHSQYVRSKSTR